MSYSTKYKLEYTSHSTHTTKIEILQKDYSGTVTELIGSGNPFTLTYDSSDSNQFSPFKNSYCTLEVKLTDELKADFVEIEDEDNFILRYYRNEVLYWSGYLLQEQYYEGDDNNYPFLSLKFYDGISRLKVFNVSDTALNSNSFSYSIADFFTSLNTLLYSSIGSTGFKGNDYLATTSTTETPNCYAVNVSNNSGDFVDITYLDCTSEVEDESTVFLNPASQVTINCADCSSFKLNGTSIGDLCSVEFISTGNVLFTVLDTSDETCITSTSNGFYESVFLLKESFFDKDGNAISLFEVLERLASSFNFTYLMHVDSLYIHNFEFSKNPQFIDFGDSNNLLSFTNHRALDSNHFWINKSKGLYFLDSLKKMEVYHTFDESPSYLITSDFTEVTKLREYTSEPDPITTEDSITFLTYADEAIARGGSPSRWYKDLFVSNDTPIKITNDSGKKYRLSFTIRFELDYGITDAEFEAMSEPQKVQLEEYLKEIEANIEVRIYYQVQSVQGGTTYYLNSGRLNNASFDSGYPWTLEVNSGVGLGRSQGMVGIDSLIEGYEYTVDIPTKSGENEMYFVFYQPYVVTNTEVLDEANTYRIEGVNMIISDLNLVRVEAIDLEEIGFEGVTNRNVFNYNLNRDKEIAYINLEEIGYKFNLLKSDNTSLGVSPFTRKLKDYSDLREEQLNTQDLILIQSLEQFGFQQQLITGDLLVRGDDSFGIFSTLSIDGKDLAIHKYSLNDKAGVYSLELLEIK